MGNPLAFMLAQPCNFPGVHVVHNSFLVEIAMIYLFMYLFLVEIATCIDSLCDILDHLSI
jgi:hypothetical protein